jgi:hypothetical protein
VGLIAGPAERGASATRSVHCVRSSSKVVDEVTALLQREVAARVGPDSTFEERREVGARVVAEVLRDCRMKFGPSSNHNGDDYQEAGGPIVQPREHGMLLGSAQSLWIDQLDENALLGRPDLEVEVSEEIHPE